MIGCALFWYESNLAFAQDIVFGKEVHKSGVHNVTENLPQITVHTDADVADMCVFPSLFPPSLSHTHTHKLWGLRNLQQPSAAQ